MTDLLPIDEDLTLLPKWRITLIHGKNQFMLGLNEKYANVLDKFLNLLKQVYNEVALLEDHCRGAKSGKLVLVLDGDIVEAVVEKLY